jgi:membrane protein DedA with SNARE-associated domain
MGPVSEAANPPLSGVEESGAGRPADNGLPWEGRAERADLLCWGGIIVAGLYALALIPLKPSLIGTHPVLLELLSGSMSAMVAAGAMARVGEGSLVLAVLAPIVGLMLFDPLYWWAGRRWGRRAAQLLTGNGPRAARLTARAERFAARFGWVAVVLAYVLPVPNALVYALVGWTGMRLVTFLVLDLLGTLIWIGLVVGLGYAIGQSAVDVAKAISHYALQATIALVVGVVALQVWRARRDARAA